MFRLITSLGLAILSPAATLPAQELAGHWVGTATRNGVATAFHLDFERHAGGWRGTFGFPEARVLEYPLDSVGFAPPTIVARGPRNAFRIEGRLAGDSLTGSFTDERGVATVGLQRALAQPPYTSEPVRFSNGQVTLAGSFYRPKAPGRHPAVVFLHGAGAEVRWGASRFFADYFARRGVASLIYDKRGTGESTGDWRRSDFEDLAGDGVAAIELVKQQPGIDPKKIGIYGHSQGGTIGPLVASRSRDLAFVISAAGGAIPMWRGEIHSLRSQVRAQGVTGEALGRADSYIDRMIAVARTGTGWDELQAEWRAANDRKEPWAELLEPPPKDFYFWAFFPRIADYDAATFWRKVTVPVLVVQASRDIYVPVDESLPAIDAALRQAGNPDYTMVTLPGAPHNLVLQPGPGTGLEWPRIFPGYADLLVSWIRYRTEGR